MHGCVRKLRNQKFFEFGSAEHKRHIAECLEERVLPLSLQMYGCRVIQKALEWCDESLRVKLIKELHGNVIRCVRDQNGNHVIQKVIESVPPHHVQFIVDAFTDKTLELSTHPYGCRVIQRLLEFCETRQKNPLMDEIVRYTLDLAMDQYGNYVIQHVMKNASNQWKDKVIQMVAQNVVTFSKHKFASNVIEKSSRWATMPSGRSSWKAYLERATLLHCLRWSEISTATM